MSAVATALAAVRRVRVGSTNPPKIAAVCAALAPWAPEAKVDGVDVPSGVAEQPLGFGEIVAGARNRARAAAAAGPCDLGVGIEDGLVMLEGVLDEPLNVGAAAVTDGRRESVALSSAFAYPPGCARRAFSERAPVGELFDALWARRAGGPPALAESPTAPGREPRAASPPSGRTLGNIGVLSLGALPREEYARHAVVCALLRFLHPDLYFAPVAEGAR